MDLLDVLCADEDEVLRSKIVSSLLRYLIDPCTDHGLGTAFLREFLYDAQTSWDAIDQALLDDLPCYPGVPDLDIEVTCDGGDGFVVLLRYETALFSLGFQTLLKEMALTDATAMVSAWSHRLGKPSLLVTSAIVPRITKTHRGVVCIGPTAIGERGAPEAIVDAVRARNKT